MMSEERSCEGPPEAHSVDLDRLQALITLGRLASGLSHELNNPTTALMRAADRLAETLPEWEQLWFEVGTLQLDVQGQALIDGLRHDLEKPLVGVSDQGDPLARSDREGDVQRLLASWGVDEPWKSAVTLTDWGWSADDLRGRTQGLASEHLPLIARWLAASCEVYGAVQVIRESAAAISDITVAMRSQIRRDEVQDSRMSLGAGFNRALTLFRSELRGIQFDMQLSPALAEVRLPSDLNQVWVNLIDNALDAMVGTGALSIRGSESAGWLQVDVVDSGPGIPEELHEHIFEPFKTTKPPDSGTGLGLSISREIVKRHGGEISVASEPGETIFTVRLPRPSAGDG